MPAAIRSPLALRAMHEHRPALVLVTKCSETSAEPTPAPARGSPSTAAGQRLVGDQLRLDDEPCRLVERLDLVEDRGDRPVHERDQPHRGRCGRPGRPATTHSTSRRSTPAAQVEHALVAAQLAVADVERLVVDEQADDLAVGDVDHRLARPPGSRSRPPRRAAGASRRSCSGRCPGGRGARPPRGSRAARCGRWRARGSTRCGRARRGRARSRRPPTTRSEKQGCWITTRSSSSARSSTTIVAPCSRRASAWPTRSTPTTQAKLARAPGLDAGERVLEHRRLLRARRPSARAPARYVSGAGFPFRCSRSATTPSIRASKSCSIPAATSTSRQLVLEETTARRRPGVARRLEVAHRARIGLDAVLADHLQDELVLSVAEAVDGLRGRAGRPPRPRAARSPARRGTSGPRHSAACRRRTRRSRSRSRTARTAPRFARPARAGTRRTSASRPRRERSPSSSAPRRGRRGRRALDPVSPAPPAHPTR